MGFASSDISDAELENTQAQMETPNQDVTPASAPAEARREWSTDQLDFFAGWADTCCEQYGVADTNKHDIVEKSSMASHCLLIAVLAKLTANDIDRSSAVVAAFPKSRAYKDQIVPRIQGTLLDPALKFYVKGLTSRIIRHIQLNPSAYGVPREVQETYMYQKGFRLDISKTCSSFRGEMKRKIDESIDGDEDIYTLTRKLCSTQVEPTVELADRIAFLRSYMRKWVEIPSTAEKPRPSWWTYLDGKCEKLWSPRKDESPQSISPVSKTFAAALRDDLAKFPPAKHVKHLRRGVRLTQWQLNVAHAVRDMQQVEVTNEPEDAVEEEAADAQ